MLKNITLSADEELIRKARKRAEKENTSLNLAFREWLRRYTNAGIDDKSYDILINSLQYSRAGKTFSRDERNER